MSRRTTKASARHHEFFNRTPGNWNIESFVKFIFPSLKDAERPPERSTRKAWMQQLERTTRTSWINQLKKIASCRKCCNERKKQRAKVLLEAYKKQSDPSSDPAVARRTLEDLVDGDPLVYVTVESMIVNSGNGNVNYAGRDQHIGTDSTTHFVEQSSSDEDDEETTAKSKSKVRRDAAFQAAYSLFTPDRKWKLPSGSTVEDIFFKAYFDKSTPPEVLTLLENWTLRIGDLNIRALFDEDEWEAILDEVKPLPSLNQEIAEDLVRRFGQVTSTQHLHTALKDYPSIDMADPNAADRRWVRRVFEDFFEIYQQKKLSHVAEMKERWFDTNVWGRIIDNCMLSLPGVHLNRSELVCQSYVLRKNRNRTDVSARMKTGPKVDGLFHAVENRGIEFGIHESAPHVNGGESSSKLLGDQKKIRRLMRDIFGRLAIEVKHDPRIIKDLEVIAYSTAGLTMQVSRMTQPKGYVLVLTTDKSVAVPQSIEQFSELLLVVALALKTKLALTRSIEAFRTRSTGNDEEALLDAILNAGEADSPDGRELPFTAETP